MPITLSDIRQAAERIQPLIHRTPVLTSETLNRKSGAKLFFKCENFQRAGAFKMRGAANAVLSLSDADRAKGVATHSSGNHGQALAKAAQSVGVPAYIVMPRTAPKVKQQAVAEYGAEIIFCEPTLQAREDTLAEVIDRTQATFVHPYNNERVITGQATAALELIEDTNELDVVMAPVGGGGLLSGTALSTHYLLPRARVVAGEPTGADDAYRSLQAGHIIPSEQPNTIADGLLTSLGDKTFPIIQEHVKEIITVNDKEIVVAMHLIWERMKIIIEPSCAVPLAALFKRADDFADKQVGIILTGGNVDLSSLPFS
ncbi:pyridoxal-phosphate dependent enzyme [Tunicatimonas pelagia]|uniref:pyridoxal-phosphate dependent enzyme n=1 Tax=Tunicatimonas pelagia TaxID=931531 RepID=UPI0026662518|nr:pyridoxal-phosphate dependent enzyme [Tunicatimonas pelagia]WKN41635.1 pyridoxal-phosphate dependent enzyme [Tunicatimonas pelagia]